MTTVELLNQCGGTWWGWMLRSLVESAVLLAVVVSVWLPLRRRISSQMGYGLFLLVLVKAAVPVPVAVPAPWASFAPGRLAERAVGGVAVEAAPVVAERGTTGRSVREFRAVPVATPGAAQSPRPRTVPGSKPIAPAAKRDLPRHPALSKAGLALLMWILVVLGLLGRLGWVHARMAWRLRECQALDGAVVPIDLTVLSRLCGLRREVRLHVTPLVAAPAVWGLFRPRVLVPPGLVETLAPGPLRWVLLHELVHIRRGDLWVVTLQRLVQIVYVLHPVVWIANRFIDVEREFACDDTALDLSRGVSRRECGAGFLAVIEQARTRPATFPAVGMSGSHLFLRRRLMRILDTRHTPRNGLSARSAGLLLLMSIVTLPYVRAQSPKPEKATTAPATVETPVPAPAPATRALELQVVDARSRKPLADVSLRIGLDRKRSDVRTDDEGRYRITDIPAGGATWLTIWAKCEGYSPMTVGWRNEAAQSGLPATFTLAMPRAASYGGVIQDEEGRPIVGATVYVRADSGVGGGTGVPSPTIFEFPARTDAQGRWSCDIIPENADYVATRLVHPDYVSDDHYGDTPQPPIEELRARTAVMVMKRGATLTGVVTDAAGKPVADALVKLGIDRWGSPQPPSTRTDAVGRYRFQVAPGSHALTVIATGFAPELKRLPAVQGTVESSFSLAPARTFRGRVVDPQGRPIAGASVAPDTWRGCRTLEDQRIKTDAEGRFAWTNAPDDEVLFDIVTANHMAIRGRPYRASDAEETITLYPFLRVRGTVTDAASGQPITAFRAVPGVVISEKPFWDYGAAVAARAGKFELRFDDPRTPMVRIEADGYEPAVSRTFRSDEGTQVQDFTLHRVNVDVLSPVVRSPDGTPLAGAEVILATEDSPPTLNNGRYYQRSRAPSTKTNAEGRFSLPVPAGAYSLVILDDRGFAEVSMPRAGAGNDITLAPWGRVEGVLRVGNRPGARLRITADYQDRTRSRFVANYLYSTQADDAGRFVIDRLVPGEYFVAAVLQLPRGIFTASGNGDRVDVRPGETARLTVGGTGRPVVGKFAAPAGIATTIDWSYGHFRISSAGPNRKFFPFNVGPDGSFRVEDVPAGTYVLNVQVYPPPGTVRQPASGPQAWANQQFAVPEMPGGRDDTPLDLGLLELTLSAGAALPPGSHQQPIAAGITGASRADDPRSDLDKIQGEWFRISTDGIKADKTVKLVVKQATNRPEDDAPEGAAAFLFEWKTEGQEGGSRNRVLLNPTGTPRTLDFFPEGEGGPKVCRGIYKLEGDTLTVCFRAVEGERPTGFVAGRRGETLDVYSRAKP